MATARAAQAAGTTRDGGGATPAPTAKASAVHSATELVSWPSGVCWTRKSVVPSSPPEPTASRTTDPPRSPGAVTVTEPSTVATVATRPRPRSAGPLPAVGHDPGRGGHAPRHLP